MLQSLRSPASPSPEAELASVAKARSRRPKAAMVGLLVLALCGGGLLLRYGPWSNRQRDLKPFTTTAERGVLSGVITANGELQAQQKVNVSPRKQGLLAQLKVDEGDVVGKEQVLAVMDRGDLDDRLQEMQALLRQAEANYQNKKEDFERRDQLYSSGAISADDFSDARFELLARQAGLVAARERVEQLEQESREKTIRAPFSGTITARYAEPGSFVTPTTAASATAGATSASIVELSQGLEVRARVPESDIGRIVTGQNAEIRVDAFPDERFQGTVNEIAPRAAKENNVTSFEVRLNFVNPQKELKIGMTADINFQTGRSAPKILVPTVAIVMEDGKPGVLLVDDKQKPRFQPVELGNSSGDQTAILNGLESGTRVFIDLPPWADRRD
ncbi:efflux RND transporter periplasmic adaptor subunit [Synechococcus sp. MU1642]|uniref:efflux RND transporter periplasmic adaptor subunit n=1 Tax=Synechococcus sp. MU1642 TaxID=2508348 RepID=UPI001CF8F020|nr:efflux RND transporter periplasmic adaptor subunit [Synechococcus sp. MU1642]MCB4406206.1 efflux RND transporter periplasmic adaptor subunit [Synechococcus sp. MU1642]